MHLQGCTAAQFCQGLVSADELTSMMRCLPDMLKFLQKYECLREEEWEWEGGEDELSVINIAVV